MKEIVCMFTNLCKDLNFLKWIAKLASLVVCVCVCEKELASLVEQAFNASYAKLASFFFMARVI